MDEPAIRRRDTTNGRFVRLGPPKPPRDRLPSAGFVGPIAPDEPDDSILIPAGPTIVEEPAPPPVRLSPADLQTALTAEVADIVAAPVYETKMVHVPRIADWPLYEQKYFRAVADVIAERGWPTNSMVAAKMGVSEKSLSTWRQRHGEVDSKVSQVLERQVDELWGRVLHRAFVLAVRGSIEHMTFLAKVTRRLGPETEGPGGVNVQVNIRV